MLLNIVILNLTKYKTVEVFVNNSKNIKYLIK